MSDTTGTASGTRNAPVAVTLVPVSAELEADRFTLLDLSDASFREPFMSETIDRAIEVRPWRWRDEIGSEEFLRAGAAYCRHPDLFVFHVGRCGSTLLANMLSGSEEWLVLKEPPIVNDLLAARLAAATASAERVDRLLRSAILFLLGTAGRDAVPAKRAVKLSAWNVTLGWRLLELFDTTPSIFLYRSPVETVASLLFQRPGWFDLLHLSREVQARFFPSTRNALEREALTPVSMLAHAWTSAVDAALALPADRVHYIDYASLHAHPSEALANLMAFVGSDASPRTLALMLAKHKIYSKNALHDVVYDPAGVHCRPPLTPRQADEVWTVAGPAWERLQTRTRTAAGARETRSASGWGTDPPRI